MARTTGLLMSLSEIMGILSIPWVMRQEKRVTEKAPTENVFSEFERAFWWSWQPYPVFSSYYLATLMFATQVP